MNTPINEQLKTISIFKIIDENGIETFNYNLFNKTSQVFLKNKFKTKTQFELKAKTQFELMIVNFYFSIFSCKTKGCKTLGCKTKGCKNELFFLFLIWLIWHL